ncbi:MAG: DUF4351 domain-containing protein [Calothrix sp. SM1_7_51]|nr:DUF4351 domain-containing protein [Calothrix sp. SM1_7_51]
MRYITAGERIEYKQGKLEGEQGLIVRQLQRRVGELPEETKSRIQSLTLTQLENLGDALLDFTNIEDLFNWLRANQSQ